MQASTTSETFNPVDHMPMHCVAGATGRIGGDGLRANVCYFSWPTFEIVVHRLWRGWIRMSGSRPPRFVRTDPAMADSYLDQDRTVVAARGGGSVTERRVRLRPKRR